MIPIAPNNPQVVLIVNNAEPQIRDFSEPVLRVVQENNLKARVLDYTKLSRNVLEEADGVILSASPMGNDIVEHHFPYYQWLLSYQKPVLGICAGHQIMGRIFGANLIRNQEAEEGFVKILIQVKDEIFNGYAANFEAFQQHQDSITCPAVFKILASSSKCENQVMKHCRLPMYGVEFHAEISNRELIKNFLRVVRKKIG